MTSEKKHDGGPAFPKALHIPAGHFYEGPADPGMSLRDYFAGKALPGVLAARVALVHDLNQESIAEECYELADAMLNERAR